MPINVPEVIYKNNIAAILNRIREDYKRYSGRGVIYGIMCTDQDAKVIAVDSLFDRGLNIWDLAALASAMHGVSRQGQDFFGTGEPERAAVVYGKRQFFVKSIGSFEIEKGRRRDLLITVLADRKVNFGLMVLQLKKYAEYIGKEVKKNIEIRESLIMSERELQKHIAALKRELFRKARTLKII